MAQTGYTPIKIYASSTASAVPLAANLDNTNGAELAINIADGKLFYKDSGGTVKVIAGAGGTGVVAGSNTQIQFNNNGVFGASSSLTWSGTTLTTQNLSLTGNVTSSLLFTDNTYDIGASGATRPRNLFVAGYGRFSGNMTIAGTTPSAGGSISLTIFGAGGGGLEMVGSTNVGGAGFVPIAAGGAQFYSYSGAAGAETFTLRGQYNGSGNWALGSAGGAIVSNIGVATYGGLYSDRGATGGATQTLLTLSASSGSDFGQISNAGATWALGYGSAVNTTNPVLTWTAGAKVGINQGAPNAALEVSATFADSAIEEIARISRVGGSALYGSNRAAALAFYDQSNGTLTAAVAGIRTIASSDYNGNLGLYYNNTGSSSASSVSQLTRAAIFGSYGAYFGGASGINTGIGLAIYGAGSYTNLTLQAGDATAGSLIDFNNVSNVLQYRMGTNHNSIGTGNFAFSYGTGPTAPAWSVLSDGTFGAGNINVTNLSGGGNIRFVSNIGANSAPQTSGTSQSAALRLRGGDNAVLDMGLSSVNTWIQATDKSALQNNYYLHLNPNGGVVAINAGATTPAITEGLFLKASSSTTEAFRIQGASTSGLYQDFYNGTLSPLFLGYGGTLSAAATNNDGVIRFAGGYKLIFSADGQYRAFFDSNGRFNMDAGSYTVGNLGTSQGFNILQSASYNDNSAHQFNGYQNFTFVIYIRANGLSAIPVYCNGGGGIAYQWTALNPQTGSWTTGSGPTINFTEASSSPNSYSVVFNGGGGSFVVTRTGGSTAYSVFTQTLANG